ncbi:MAG TPA: dihydropteroate synthase [Solirubrobacteraceae bacterium]|jgi:dihydropteroate synthase
MGVVNVTPDSFSDGGLFLDAGAAIVHARELIGEGAEIVDVGGESTRPGAEPVSAAEELRRVLPVVEGIAAADTGAQVSIDTSKAVVARACVEAGATLVNDVSALRADPGMVGLVAESGVECCLMHMRGEPRTMQADPRYDDVVDDVRSFLEERMVDAVREGVSEQRIMLDPGIGFGKTLAHNLALLARLDELTSLGRPLVVGTSRKSFIGRILADAAGQTEPVAAAERLEGTIATNVLAYERGASVFRVHDVAPVRAALAVAAATLGARWDPGQTRTPTR